MWKLEATFSAPHTYESGREGHRKKNRIIIFGVRARKIQDLFITCHAVQRCLLYNNNNKS